jgi:hypothetical protein
MRQFIISTLIAILFTSASQAQTPQTPPQQTPAKPAPDPKQLATEWIDRLNALDDWHLSVDGKEEGVDQVVDRMMELFTPDALAEVPPHDEEQLGPVMLVGSAQVRKWVEKIARSQVKINYIVKRQTEKEVEGEMMVYSKPLPWGGLGISFQIIAASSQRKDRRRFMEPGAVFLQYREDGKISRLRLLQTEKDEVIDY